MKIKIQSPSGPDTRSRDKLPLLTIRIHTDRSSSVRLIKIREDGPKGRRWIHYARWWWEQNRGPVPAGRRIFHLDGNSLNDDPANLAMGTAADAAAIWHDLNPEKSARNYAKLKKATAECNRLRAATHRARHWLPTRWYPVDLDRQLIYNRPRRQRWNIYADVGLPVTAETCRFARPASLGFPDINLMTACILHILAEKGALRGYVLRNEVSAFRQLQGFKPQRLSRSVMSSCISSVRDWIETIGTHRKLKEFRITDAGLAARGPRSSIIPMRGSEFGWPPFVHFTRLDEDAPLVEAMELAVQ